MKSSKPLPRALIQGLRIGNFDLLLFILQILDKLTASIPLSLKIYFDKNPEDSYGKKTKRQAILNLVNFKKCDVTKTKFLQEYFLRILNKA